MKRNMIKIAPKWSLVYSILSILFLLPLQGQTEKLSKRYQQEIAVSEFSQIISQGYWNLKLESHGRMRSSREGKDYILVPGGNDDVPALRLKEYRINTWDKNIVRLEVEIVLVPDDDKPEDAQELLDQLKIEVKRNEKNEILIDENLNIAKFGFENGFFSGNENVYTLENGKEFRVKGLSLQAALFIPKKSNLYLRSELGDISMGDLEGRLEADLLSCRLKGSGLGELVGRFQFYAKIEFDKINKASIQSHNSSFTAKEIGSLNLGQPSTLQARIPILEEQRQHRSSQSKYQFDKVGSIEIYESTNDKFKIGQLGSLASLHSTFSDYEIKELQHKLSLRAKNGDLIIESIHSDFESIEIDNKISEIKLNLAGIDDLQIKAFQNSYTEYHIPAHMRESLIEKKAAYLKGSPNESGSIQILCNSCVLRIQD